MGTPEGAHPQVAEVRDLLQQTGEGARVPHRARGVAREAAHVQLVDDGALQPGGHGGVAPRQALRHDDGRDVAKAQRELGSLIRAPARGATREGAGGS